MTDHDAQSDAPTRLTTTDAAGVSFDFTGMTPEMRDLMFGNGLLTSRPEPAPMAMVIETKEMVPAEPRKPTRVRGFRAWWNGTNRKARRAYEAAYENWCAAGRPEFTTRKVSRVIPNVRIDYHDALDERHYALEASVRPARTPRPWDRLPSPVSPRRR